MFNFNGFHSLSEITFYKMEQNQEFIPVEEQPSAGSPKNVLYVDTTNLIWYSRPKNRNVSYYNPDLLRSGFIKFPGLIFHLKGKELFFYSIKRLPSNKVILYSAPISENLEKIQILDDFNPGDHKLEFLIESMEILFEVNLFKNPISLNDPLSLVYGIYVDLKSNFPLNELKPIKSNGRFVTIQQYINTL